MLVFSFDSFFFIVATPCKSARCIRPKNSLRLKSNQALIFNYSLVISSLILFREQLDFQTSASGFFMRLPHLLLKCHLVMFRSTPWTLSQADLLAVLEMALRSSCFQTFIGFVPASPSVPASARQASSPSVQGQDFWHFLHFPDESSILLHCLP